MVNPATPSVEEEKLPTQFDNEDIQHLSLMDITPKLTKPWFMYPYILRLNFLLLGALLAQVVCGYDGSMTNGLQSVEKWEAYFNHPKGAILGTMSNGMSIGSLITMPFTTFIVDRIGRRWSVIVGCFIICIGAAIQAASKDFGMFVGGRIVLGIGGVISLTAAPPLVTECAYPTQRPVVTALLMPSWPIGALIAALVTWAPYTSNMKNSNWGWRLPSLLQIAMPIVQIVCAFFGPESPRWLIDKGREKEALDFFTQYHAGGDASHPLVAYEMAEISATIEEEKAQKLGSWFNWFQSRPMFHRFAICLTVPLMQQLSGNALITFYLTIILNNTGITSSLDQLRINLGINAWTLICSLCGSYIVGKFKRRHLFLTGYASMFVVYILFTAISAVNQERNFKDKGLAVGVVFSVFLYQMVYQICSPIAFTYTMEIAPYSLRSKASLIYQFSGAIVGFFNNYVNPVAMSAITWKYYIVYIVWLAVQFTYVYFVFPETFGTDLEEVNQVFNDGIASGRQAIEKAHIDLNQVSKHAIEVEHQEVQV